MNREAKISLLRAIKSGKATIKEFQISGAVCLPSWVINQFDKPEDLLQDLKQTWGQSVRIIWDGGKVFVIPPKEFKNKWFNYE